MKENEFIQYFFNMGIFDAAYLLELIEKWNIDPADLRDNIIECNIEFKNIDCNLLYYEIYSIISNEMENKYPEIFDCEEWDCYINGALDTHFYYNGNEVKDLKELINEIENPEEEEV